MIKREKNGVKITAVDIKKPVFVAVVNINAKAEAINEAAVKAEMIK